MLSFLIPILLRLVPVIFAIPAPINVGGRCLDQPNAWLGTAPAITAYYNSYPMYQLGLGTVAQDGTTAEVALLDTSNLSSQVPFQFAPYAAIVAYMDCTPWYLNIVKTTENYFKLNWIQTPSGDGNYWSVFNAGFGSDVSLVADTWAQWQFVACHDGYGFGQPEPPSSLWILTQPDGSYTMDGTPYYPEGMQCNPITSLTITPNAMYPSAFRP